MPSTRKTVRSRKAAAPANSRGAPSKTAKKTGADAKAARGKAAKLKVATRRKAAASARAKVAAKAKSARAAKKTVKNAAKTAARTSRKTTSAVKKPAAKRSAAKSAAASAAKRVEAVSSRSEAAPVTVMTGAKPAVARNVVAKSSAASASVKVASVKPTKAPSVKAPKATVSSPPVAAARATATPAAPIPPALGEPIQVRQNLSQPVSKPASALAASVQSHARAALPARSAPAAQKPGAAAKARATSQKLGFKLSEFIVYPAHGVGQIVGIETQEVAGFSLELFVVSFVKDKMILKVPTSKAPAVGMRKLSDADVVEKALGTLSGRARIKRTMWSRRAQEYEAKINSGDLVTIAEVVRDLYRSDTQPEQSYSERQLYEAALDRLAREIAVVRKLLDQEALALIESFLAKAPRRNPKAESDAAEEGDVERAA